MDLDYLGISFDVKGGSGHWNGLVDWKVNKTWYGRLYLYYVVAIGSEFGGHEVSFLLRNTIAFEATRSLLTQMKVSIFKIVTNSEYLHCTYLSKYFHRTYIEWRHRIAFSMTLDSKWETM